MVDTNIQTEALRVLDGFEQMVQEERLVHGDYLSGPPDPGRSGAVCRGYRACLVGSLWLAGGAYEVEDGKLLLIGAGWSHRVRRTSLAKNGGLGLLLAYDAINQAAEPLCEPADVLKGAFGLSYMENGPAECLFEGFGNVKRKSSRLELLELSRTARQLILEDAVRETP